MIKLTRIASDVENAPKIFIVSGGPGLSSQTMRDLDILKRSFELIYLDFQGTNDSEYLGKKSFDELSQSISQVVKNESGRKYILGHSFGGIFAADVMLRETLDGLICIAAPFTERVLLAANDNYASYMTPELSKAEQLWSQEQDDKSMAKWLSEYGVLYFTNPKGKELLLQDKASASFFKDNRADAANKEDLLKSLSDVNKTKIFICGKEDKLLPSEILIKDAELGNFDVFEIEEASHFVTFDRPELVASLIENKLLRPEGE
ncbi:MAG: alpha/beta fold hydrolase [Bacteriovoracaceae bacterium]